jgi:Rho termination factor, N-terminal domain
MTGGLQLADGPGQIMRLGHHSTLRLLSSSGIPWGLEIACGGHTANGRTNEEVPAMPNPSIKNEKMYEELRREGNSKQKSARIANAAAARGKSAVGKKGGKSGSYDDWTVPQLKKRAKELGISGYSGLNKDKLIAKIRNS